MEEVKRIIEQLPHVSRVEVAQTEGKPVGLTVYFRKGPTVAAPFLGMLKERALEVRSKSIDVHPAPGRLASLGIESRSNNWSAHYVHDKKGPKPSDVVFRLYIEPTGPKPEFTSDAVREIMMLLQEMKELR